MTTAEYISKIDALESLYHSDQITYEAYSELYDKYTEDWMETPSKVLALAT